jgi:two-component system chemotaxis response regulator CheB
MDAFKKVIALKPDIVTMDIEMPVLGGLEAIEKIMAEHPVPILVVTALTGVRTAFSAVSKGALDVIEKPDISIENVRTLISKVRMLARVDIAAHMATMGKRAKAPSSAGGTTGVTRLDGAKLIAVASSTGGPQAIYKFLSLLPATFPLPILITQHIAEGFTQGMVDWLAGGTPLTVSVAAHGERIKPGHVYVNPAEYSMKMSGQIISLGEPDAGLLYHPSCDTMLRSVASTFRQQVIGLILSGMGSDGVEGMRAIKAAGGTTLAQDAKSSVVYGMNKLAVEKGHIDKVLPLADIAAGLMQLAGCR